MAEVSPSLFNFFNTHSFKSMIRVTKIFKNSKGNSLPTPKTKASRKTHGPLKQKYGALKAIKILQDTDPFRQAVNSYPPDYPGCHGLRPQVLSKD